MTLDKRNYILPLCVMLALIIAIPVQIIGSGDGQVRREIASGSPAAEPMTHSSFSGSDMNMYAELNDVSSGDGSTLSLDRSVPNDIMSVDSESGFIKNINGRRTIASDTGSTFISYTTRDVVNETFSFWFIMVNENENMIEDPILIHEFGNSIGGYLDMDIGNGNIYFLMSNISRDTVMNRLFVKKVPLDDWFKAPEYGLKRLDLEGDVSSEIDILATEEGAVAFWVVDEDGDLFRSVLSGTTWSAPYKLREDAAYIASETIFIDGQERVLFIYGQKRDDRINSTTSLDGGNTFSTNHDIGFTDAGMSGISAASDGERVHVACINRISNRIYHFMSDNGQNWIESGSVVQFADDPLYESFHIATYRDQVHIVFNNGGHLDLQTSHDRGNTFPERTQLTYGSSFYPSFESNKGYIAFWNGTMDEMKVQRFEIALTGSFVTETISPMGIRSWEGVGIDVQGLDKGSKIYMVLKDGDGNRLFPQMGWHEITGEISGNLAGIEFDHVTYLSEDWALPDTDITSLYLEIRIDRSPGDDPVIDRMVLDHTTRFPLIEDFETDTNIQYIDNLTLDNGLLSLDSNVPRGETLIGPIMKEIYWPDVMTLDLDAFNNRVNVRCALLTADMIEVPSFSLDDSDGYNTITGMEQMKWNGHHFGDLSDEISTIYVLIEISKQEPTADPVLNSIILEYSQAPTISSHTPPPTEVMRGGSATFGIVPMDREDDPNELIISVQSKPLNATGWGEDDHVDGAAWSEGEWTVTFSPPIDAELGPHQFRAMVTDTTMNSSEYVDLPFTIEVKNVIPEPPLAFLRNDIIRTGDEVLIEIERNGTDLENPDGETTHFFRSYQNGIEVTEGLSTGEGYIVIPGDMVKKDDEWWIGAYTFDGVDESDPCEVSFKVINTAPVLGDLPEEIIVTEDGVHIHDERPVEWFFDRDGDDLEIMIETGTGIDHEIISGQLSLIPETDFNGNTWIRVTASDGEFKVSSKIPVSVVPVNDMPLLFLPENITVMQGEEIFIPVVSMDLCDCEPVSITSNIREIIPGIEDGGNLFVHPNGSLRLRTDNGMIGDHEVIFTTSDGNLTNSKTINISIINVNDPPTRPIITVTPDDRIFIGEGDVILNGTTSDPDLLWGDTLDLHWTSTVQGDLGNGESIDVTLTPGEHTITFSVTDSGGLSNSSTVMISVLDEPVEEDPVMRTVTLILILMVIGIIIGIIIGLVIFIFSRKRKEEEKEKEGEEKGSELEEGAQEGKGEGNGNGDDNGKEPEKRNDGSSEDQSEEGVGKNEESKSRSEPIDPGNMTGKGGA